MHSHPPIVMSSSSPPFLASGAQTPSAGKVNTSPSRDHQTTTSTQKKSSVLSLGFPSLLKSSSRRSLHSDAKDSAKEAEKERLKKLKQEKDKNKKDEKDRSESRISLLMGGGRRRGKVICISLMHGRFLKGLIPDAIIGRTTKGQIPC